MWKWIKVQKMLCGGLIMELKRVLVLVKSLPNCPKGRLFKEDISGNFFHSMTDKEVIKGKFKLYKFTKKEVKKNKKWFYEL